MSRRRTPGRAHGERLVIKNKGEWLLQKSQKRRREKQRRSPQRKPTGKFGRLIISGISIGYGKAAHHIGYLPRIKQRRQKSRHHHLPIGSGMMLLGSRGLKIIFANILLMMILVAAMSWMAIFTADGSVRRRISGIMMGNHTHRMMVMMMWNHRQCHNHQHHRPNQNM